MKKIRSTYKPYSPISKLSDCVDSLWVHHNPSSEVEELTITPDSFFKILIYVKNGQVTNYYMTGLWTEPKHIPIPPQTHTIGCRFNILAPEYLLQTEVASILNTTRQLPLHFLNVPDFSFEDLDLAIKQFQKALLKIRSDKAIEPHKFRMSQAIYKAKGSLSANELANQIHLTNRTINRYLNKYIGVSLITYINIQRAFKSLHKIPNGELSPTNDFYDQAHFIKEVKRFSGETPKKIFKEIDSKFLQVKNAYKK